MTYKTKPIVITGAGTEADPIDLSQKRIAKWGNAFGILLPLDAANAVVGKTIKVQDSEGETVVRVVKGFYEAVVRDDEGEPIMGEDGKVLRTLWTGKGGTEQGKRFVVFPTKKEQAAAAAAKPAAKGGTVYRSDAPAKGAKPAKGAPAAPAPATAPAPAPAASAPAVPAPLTGQDAIGATSLALKAAGFSAADIVAALKEQGLIA